MFENEQLLRTFSNISPETKLCKKHKKEEIHLLLTGIGDEIYSTIDACKTAHDMWIAIERRQQGESLNKQDVKENIYLGFWQDFTSRRCKSQLSPYYFRKSKWVKDYTYHKEKTLMCKKAEKGVPLRVEQSDWLDDTDEEIDEQELEAHYSFMAKIQEVVTTESGSDAEPLKKVQPNADYNVFADERQHSEQPEFLNDTYVVEKDDSNYICDSLNMCDNDNQVDQNATEYDEERDVLANLIANLTLDTKENKIFKSN
ncbi:hypothetical protein Tco_1004001 [Tanacetum coccineum]|uniref:Uncharacterized protein n=1 Tax=Tanacetum coccineum TaxID=301880 RepID=A0ABQ5FC22_9ASTR